MSYYQNNTPTHSFPLEIFEPYLSDARITDINYNGKDLWVDHLDQGRMYFENFSDEESVMKAALRFSNMVNAHFNMQTPLLEADYGDLRVSFIHPIVSGKLSVSIRKTTSKLRFNEEEALVSGYMTQDTLTFLRKAVALKKNMMVSGLPGCGKTELVKFLSQYIDTKHRVITIEDSRELHYDRLFPNRDTVSLKVSSQFDYETAIKASMRQRPNWILVSEVRGQEIYDLLRSVSTGAHLLSTIHARSAKDIPMRMLYMMEGNHQANQILLKQLYDLIDIGIHVEMAMSDQGIKRYIREIVIYHNESAIPVYIHNQLEDFQKGQRYFQGGHV